MKKYNKKVKTFLDDSCYGVNFTLFMNLWIHGMHTKQFWKKWNHWWCDNTTTLLLLRYDPHCCHVFSILWNHHTDRNTYRLWILNNMRTKTERLEYWSCETAPTTTHHIMSQFFHSGISTGYFLKWCTLNTALFCLCKNNSLFVLK